MRRRLTRGLIEVLKASGIDLRAVAASSGLPDPELPISPEDEDALLELALADVRDPTFGLRAGIKIRPELFGVGERAAMAARSLEEAFRRIARYKVMLSSACIELDRRRDTFVVRSLLPVTAFRTSRLRADGELAFLLGFARVATGVRLTPRAIHVQTPTQCSLEDYERLLGCPVQLDDRPDEIIFSRADAERPLVTHAPELEDFYVDRAERQLEGSLRSTAEQTRAMIARLMRGSTPDVADAARGLGISTRTLQRRLASEGTSFGELVAEVRRQTSRELLTRTSLPLEEIAYLVGFSRPTSLHRAFMRWEGRTLTEYRRTTRS